MTPALAWTVIVGMALTNLALRVLPLSVLSRMRMPRVVERWLSYVPVSVMAAMVALEVLRPGGRWIGVVGNPYLLAAVPTALVYRFTNSFIGATIVGVLSFLALRYMLG
jgi:branched-subunit amino acid transport protein